MVDKEKILLQVSRLEDSLKHIAELEKKIDEPIYRAALERFLQVAIEEVINIGNEVIVKQELGTALTYKEIFQILEKHNVISRPLSRELQYFCGFRNRLVHLYWEIKNEEFRVQVKKKHKLLEFATIVVKKYC